MTSTFGFALVSVGDVLYNFRSSPINGVISWSTDKLADLEAEPGVIVEYQILLGLCNSILVIFIALRLAFTTNERQLRRFLWDSRQHWEFEAKGNVIPFKNLLRLFR